MNAKATSAGSKAKTTKKPAAAKKSGATKVIKVEELEKILVSIDGTEASQKAIDYLTKMSGIIKHCEITLFHVLPSVPPEMLEDGGSENPDVERELKEERDEEIDKWEDQLKAETKKVFEDSKKRLLDSGMGKDQIKTKISVRSADIGKDIVDTAQKGGYSTIVVGRRGVSFLKELALGSISYRVVKLAKDCTVWVVH